MSRPAGHPAAIFGALGRDRTGATAVEFALTVLPLLLLLCGIPEFGRLLWTQTTLHFAVEAAARCGSIDAVQCGSTGAVQNFAAAHAVGIGLSPAAVAVTAASCGTAVSASYPFQFVVTGFFPYAITLTAQTCFPK